MSESWMRRLFTYGSLMCDDIMARVAGDCTMVGNAVLPGYRCLAVKDEEYPAIVLGEGAKTQGVLYEKITDAGWAQLDEFEGEMYERQTVTVTLASGESVRTNVYVFRPEFAHRLTDRDWQFDSFLKTGKAAFLEKYVGFSRIS